MCVQNLGKVVRVVEPYPAWKVAGGLPYSGRKRVGPFSSTPLPPAGEWIVAKNEPSGKAWSLGKLRTGVVGFHVFRCRGDAEEYCRRWRWAFSSTSCSVKPVEIRGLCRPGKIWQSDSARFLDVALVEEIRFVEEEF